VYYATAEGITAFLPAAWTDVGPKDLFVEVARGRTVARIEDLLELSKMAARAVKQITPKV